MNIIIEGNIGSGKSTILKNLKEQFCNVNIIQEPVEQWTNYYGNNLLELVYKEPKMYLFNLQILVLKTFIERNLSSANSKKTNGCYLNISERSLVSATKIFSQYGYERKHLSEIEINLLEDLYSVLIPHFQIDKIVYLQTEPKVCYERMCKRNRKEENEINIEYIENLHILHESIYSKEFITIANKDIEIIKLNGNKETEQLIEDLKKFINLKQ